MAGDPRGPAGPGAARRARRAASARVTADRGPGTVPGPRLAAGAGRRGCAAGRCGLEQAADAVPGARERAVRAAEGKDPAQKPLSACQLSMHICRGCGASATARVQMDSRVPGAEGAAAPDYVHRQNNRGSDAGAWWLGPVPRPCPCDTSPPAVIKRGAKLVRRTMGLNSKHCGVLIIAALLGTAKAESSSAGSASPIMPQIYRGSNTSQLGGQCDPSGIWRQVPTSTP